MALFKNKTFNLIYMHGALQAIAVHGGEAFVFVFLLKAGLSVPAVLLCIAALFASRMIFRRFVLPVARRFGLRNTLIFGILLEGLTYPVLSQVSEIGPLLFSYLAMYATSSSFYWTSYHGYVALIGDSAHRGTQISGLEFIGTIMGIVVPVTAGLLLTWFAPLVSFSIVGLAMAASAIPLSFGPNPVIAADAVVPRATRRLAFTAMAADGLRASAFHFTWLIALFITLGESFAAFGGALALAGIVGAVAGLFIGKSIDLGRGKRALGIGIALLTLAQLGRAFGYDAVWSALLANAAVAVVWPIYAVAISARVYEIAGQSPCPLRFYVVAEGGWDTGTATGCLLAAGMTWAGLPFLWPMLVGLIGCAMIWRILAPTFDAGPFRPEARAGSATPAT